MKYLAVIFLILFVAAFGRLDRYFFKENASFCPNRILPRWNHCPQVETRLNPEIKPILNQPFTYLDKGEQSFVFLSQDGKWVIKFLRVPRFLKRFDYKRTKKALTLDSFGKTLMNTKNAYEHLQEETQVFYTHLQKTHSLNQTLLLIDKFGRTHLIELDDTLFILQAYGEVFFRHLDILNLEESKQLLKKTAELFSNLYEKGYIDNDPSFERNFGVYNTNPFIIDVGHLESHAESYSRMAYMYKMTHAVLMKLERDSPELSTYFKKLLQ